MSDRWIERFFSRTRGRIVLLLRQEDRTVADLSEALDLTTSAIRSQLTKLERDDLVVPTGKRSAVRKPEVTYGLTEQAERLFPKTYDAVLDALLDTLADRQVEHEDVLREVGRRLAQQFSQHVTSEDPDERVEEAGLVLETLGGVPNVQRGDDGELIVCGRNCPFSAVVQHHSAICLMTESLLSALTDRPVRQSCSPSGESPQCRFTFPQTDGELNEEP